MDATTKQKEYNKETDASWGRPFLQIGNISSLRKKSLLFFTLTILMTLMVAAGVLYESANHWTLLHESMGNGDVAGSGNRLSGFPPVYLAGSLVLLLCTLIVAMIFFQRNIILPLERIGNATRRMTEGQLNTPIRIKAKDEIGRIGELINDLAINMQEVLLYIWNYTHQNFVLLDRISEQLNDQPDGALTPPWVKDDIARIRQDNEDLKFIVTTFDYFEVKLEHEKMVSDPLQDTVEPEV